MNASPFIIATAQSSITSDIASNGRNIRRLIRQASKNGARLVHFPESALSGYIKSQITAWADVDWRQLAAEMDKIALSAKTDNIWVVLGCNHPSIPPGRPFNSLYIIDDAGQYHARYDKRFCSHTEITNWYAAGTLPVTFDIDDLRFGCALCIEINFPHLFAEYERLDVDCMLVSSYSEDPIFGIKARAHASNECYWLSFSVPAQCSDALASHFIGPTGEIIGTCRSGREDLLYAPINKTDAQWKIPLQHARPWRRKARRGDIYTDAGKPTLGDPATTMTGKNST